LLNKMNANNNGDNNKHNHSNLLEKIKPKKHTSNGQNDDKLAEADEAEPTLKCSPPRHSGCKHPDKSPEETSQRSNHFLWRFRGKDTATEKEDLNKTGTSTSILKNVSPVSAAENSHMGSNQLETLRSPSSNFGGFFHRFRQRTRSESTPTEDTPIVDMATSMMHKMSIVDEDSVMQPSTKSKHSAVLESEAGEDILPLQRRRSRSEASQYLVLRKMSRPNATEIVGRLSIDEKPLTKILSMFSCFDLMPKQGTIVSLDTNLTIYQTLVAMLSSGALSALIWDSDCHCNVGVMTLTNLLGVMLNNNDDFRCWLDRSLKSWMFDPVKSAYSPNPDAMVTLHAGANLIEAITLLCSKRLHRIPITDTYSGNFMYILSTRSILKFLHQYLSDLPLPQDMYKPLDQFKFGTWENVHRAKGEDTVSEVLHVLLNNRISCLPIVQVNEAGEETVQDIITKVDIVNFLLKFGWKNLQELSVDDVVKCRPSQLTLSNYNLLPVLCALFGNFLPLTVKMSNKEKLNLMRSSVLWSSNKASILQYNYLNDIPFKLNDRFAPIPSLPLGDCEPEVKLKTELLETDINFELEKRILCSELAVEGTGNVCHALLRQQNGPGCSDSVFSSEMTRCRSLPDFKGLNVPFPSISYSKVLEPTRSDDLKSSVVERSQESQLDVNTIEEFEPVESTPFDAIQLNTIDDLEELRLVLECAKQNEKQENILARSSHYNDQAIFKYSPVVRPWFAQNANSTSDLSYVNINAPAGFNPLTSSFNYLDEANRMDESDERNA
ncbi:5'-AMP-activated protein kinase subunit gamma-2, partial [Trichinella pseudospiralis]